MSLLESVLDDLDFQPATVKSLHTGISETFLVTHPDGRKIVIKQLREEREADQTPQSEMAWLTALAKQNIACICPYFDHADLNCSVKDGTVFSFYRYVPGHEPDRSVLQNYEMAGRLLSQLHTAGQRIDMTGNPLLQNRPVYDVDRLVRQFYPVIETSDLFDATVKETLLDMAHDIEGHFPTDRMFIHGDFHFGNLLQQDDLTVIDFDECGYGSRYYDIGTMLLHTMAAKNEDAWSAFLNGYGRDALDEADVKYGAAARIFYMIGMVPNRSHVPDVAKDASGIIDRYTNRYLANVLNGITF